MISEKGGRQLRGDGIRTDLRPNADGGQGERKAPALRERETLEVRAQYIRAGTDQLDVSALTRNETAGTRPLRAPVGCDHGAARQCQRSPLRCE